MTARTRRADRRVGTPSRSGDVGEVDRGGDVDAYLSAWNELLATLTG
jgi:hypothetical protein